MRKLLINTAKIVAGTVVVVLALLFFFQERLIYIPRPYPPGQVEQWITEPGTKLIPYQTADGPQQAYLLSLSPNPKHLWVYCGGSGSRAIELTDWLRGHAPKDDAWLMVDIPGYGTCAGSPSPDSIARSMRVAVPAAIAALHWSPQESKGRLRFFGHSLGCAVCLIAARENDIRSGVLMTPFTSAMEMSSVVTGIPLGFLVRHRFDNRARLMEIEAKGGGQVIIVHGTSDECIPIRMARSLQQSAPHTVHLTEIPGGKHLNLLDVAPGEVEKALRQISDAS